LGNAEDLAIGAEAINLMARTLREVKNLKDENPYRTKPASGRPQAAVSLPTILYARVSAAISPQALFAGMTPPGSPSERFKPRQKTALTNL
jgi:hypothetical protein